MFHRPWISYALVSITLFLIADAASAQLFRRRRSYKNYTYNYTYSTNNYLQLTPASDDPSDEFRYLDAAYSYNRGNKPDVAFSDKIRVFLRVNDKQVLSSKETIVAEVKVMDLRDENSTTVRYVPLSIDRDEEGPFKTAFFDVTNQAGKDDLISPSRVYRLFVNLHRKSDRYGKKTVLGRMSYPYYAATSGKSRLQQARRQIVMRTFREWYYAKKGWQTDEYYVMDCYAYYMWATGFCTRGATDGQTNLWQLFDEETPFGSGGDIPELAKENPIHGDYVRMPGHSFMLLAYDAEQKQVWTMEGNFGATIEIVTRSVDPGWTVGHLVDRHIRRGMFQVAAEANDETMTEMAGE